MGTCSTCQSLEKRVAGLEKILDVSPDLIFRLDRELRHIYVNQRVLDVTGLSREEYLGSTNRELGMPEELCDLWDRTFQKVFEDGQSQEIEFTYPTSRNGRLYHMRVTAEEASDGTVEAVMGVTQDITKRRLQSEERMLANVEKERDKLRTLIDSMVDEVWFCDAEGNLSFANTAAARGLGFKRTEEMYQRLPECLSKLKIFTPDGRPRPQEDAPLLRSLAGETIKNAEEIVLHSESNKILHRTVNSAPLISTSDQIIGAVAVVRDTTERKRAEEALAASESFHRQTLESIPGMVFTTRPDGYCDYQSKQWVEYTGVPMSEHLGDGWNHLLHPDDRPRAFTAWRAAVEDNAKYDLEYRVRRFDGVYEWFRVIGNPIQDDAGEIVRWFGVAMNIQALKQTEIDLQKLNETLEQRVAERTRQLRDLIARVFSLEQKERRRFARFLHDHIQQTLVAGKMKAEHAQQAIGAGDKARGLLADCLRLLSETIANTRTMNMDMAPTLLFETGVTVCLQWLERWAGKNLGLKITTHVHGAERAVTDEGGYLLYRMLRELLFNIHKHAATDEAEIIVTFLTGGGITVSVEDKGKGFSPNLLEHIPLEGLGLPSMTEQIEALGGEIHIYSRPGDGTRVDLAIPSGVVDSPDKQDVPPPEKAASKPNGKEKSGTLLIVDDQEDLRFTLKLMLEDLTSDLHLLEARSSQEAIEMTRTHLPDVILMDVSMPGISGIEATKAIRKEFSDVVIIGLSMHDAEDTERIMKKAGAQEYICKNSPVELIFSTVNKYLR